MIFGIRFLEVKLKFMVYHSVVYIEKKKGETNDLKNTSWGLKRKKEILTCFSNCNFENVHFKFQIETSLVKAVAIRYHHPRKRKLNTPSVRRHLSLWLRRWLSEAGAWSPHALADRLTSRHYNKGVGYTDSTHFAAQFSFWFSLVF